MTRAFAFSGGGRFARAVLETKARFGSIPNASTDLTRVVRQVHKRLISLARGSGAMSRLSVQVESFKPLRKGSLLGFADFVIPELRLRVKEASIHQSNGRRWVGLPAKPQIDREGRVRRDDRGKRDHDA